MQCIPVSHSQTLATAVSAALAGRADCLGSSTAHLLDPGLVEALHVAGLRVQGPGSMAGWRLCSQLRGPLSAHAGQVKARASLLMQLPTAEWLR